MELGYDDATVIAKKDKYYGTVISMGRAAYLWPKDEDNINKWFYIRLISYSLPLKINMLGTACYLIRMFRLRIFTVNMIEDIIVFTSGICFTITFHYSLTIIRRLVHFIREPFRYITDEEDPKLPEEVHKKNEFITKMAFLLLSFAVIAFGVWRNYDQQSCHDMNRAYNLSTVCGMIMSVEFPFDFSEFPYKYIVLCGQYFTIWSIMHMIIFYAFLTYTSMTLGALQGEHLVSLLLENGCNDEIQFVAFLRRWILYHERLMRLSDALNRFLLVPTGIVFICTSFLMGMLLVHSIITRSINSIIYLLGWLIGMLALHQNGQNIIDVNDKAIRTVYEVKWYKLSPKYRYLVHMILMRTQKPPEVVFGPLFNMSSASFMTLMKVSYSFMTFTMHMMDKRKIVP